MGMSIVTDFGKIECTYHLPLGFSRRHKNTLLKRKSASDEYIYKRDILIFPVVSFVDFFIQFFLALQKLKFVTLIKFVIGGTFPLTHVVFDPP